MATSIASRSVSTISAMRAPSGVFAVMQFMYVFTGSIRSATRRRTTSAIPMPTALPSVSSVRSRTTIRWIERRLTRRARCSTARRRSSPSRGR